MSRQVHDAPDRFLHSLIALLALSAVLGSPPELSAQAPLLPSARIEAIAAMLPERPAGVGRPISDRPAWEALSRHAAMKENLQEAEALLKEPLPETTDDLYLEYSRTGNRTHWQDLNFKRRGRLPVLVLAECVENKGRFIPALRALIESLCAERTWVMPAHDGGLANFKGTAITIDLASSSLGWSLATADWMLGERLGAPTRLLLQERVRQRILEPFEKMVTGRQKPDGWLTRDNNWNAVCLAGVTGAALALVEPRRERALFIAAAEKYSTYFLASFTPDGYCSEGVGYWNYGFGHYLLLGETVWQATAGRVDLLAGEKVRAPALYGARIEIVPGVCPAFADCAVNAQPSGDYLWYISRKWRLGLPGADAAPGLSVKYLFQVGLWAFPNSVSRPEPPAEPWPGPGARTWFEEAGVLIARPGDRKDCRLAVALKGGHNNENHNHNDVGSFIVVADGKLVLVDPGAEVYTRRTFSDRRYDSKVLNSFGHPVPLVAGRLQRTGPAARGRVLRTDFTDDADTLALDIRSAYQAPELEKLERTFVYSRDGTGSLTVIDDVAFKSPQAFGSAVVTFGEWKQLGPDRLRVADGGAAVEISVRAEGGEVGFKAEQIDEDLTARRKPTRIGIDFTQPVAKGRISLAITPAAR
ncbi:MAG: heparinase II/III family protein [Phycisphaerae bacterium]|jgi:hypothetical protein